MNSDGPAGPSAPDTQRTALQPRRGLASFLLRIALPIAVLSGGLLAAIALAGNNPPTEAATLIGRIAFGVFVSAAVIAVLAVLIRFIDRRPPAAFGLTPPADAGRAFLGGILVWLVPAAVMFAVLALAGTPLVLVAAPPEAALVVGLAAVAVLTSEAVPEELVFRGYVTGVLSERFRGWAVIAIQTALFTGFALLLRGYTGAEDLSLFIAMGVVLGYLRMLTGSVWTTVGFHTAFQTGAQLVLTHEAVEFAGAQFAAMLALGVVPFTVGAIAVPVLAPRHPRWFGAPTTAFPPQSS